MLSLCQTVSCNYTFQFQHSWSQQLYNSLSTICLAWERMCSPDCTRQRMANIWELNWVLEKFLILYPGPSGKVGQRWNFQDFQGKNEIQLWRYFLLSSFFPLFQKGFSHLFLRFALIQGMPCLNKWQGVESAGACGEICNSRENSCDFAIQMWDRQ